MRTKTITIYKFKELSEEAQEKALNNLCEINVDYEWWENIYEDANCIGLKITSFALDRNRHTEGDFILSTTETAQNIINNHGEKCETYRTAKAFLENYNPILADYMDDESENYESKELENQLLELEEDFLKDILEDYSILLQKEYEYLISSEAIAETIEANEYEFDINGNLI